MTGSLAGRCAVITGAGGGLGRAFALGFARAGTVTVDVADEASTAAMAAAAIDALVNNAAVYAGLERRSFDQIEVTEWDRVMAVNLRGPWLCTRACADALRDGGGAIINVASATVLSGSPLWAHYVASKSALIGLSRVLAANSAPTGSGSTRSLRASRSPMPASS